MLFPISILDRRVLGKYSTVSALLCRGACAYQEGGYDNTDTNNTIV